MSTGFANESDFDKSHGMNQTQAEVSITDMQQNEQMQNNLTQDYKRKVQIETEQQPKAEYLGNQTPVDRSSDH